MKVRELIDKLQKHDPRRRPMANDIEHPHNCDNCRHATDYWPMYCGDDHRKWGTVRCSKDSPRKAKRYKLTHTCKRWKEREASHD